MTEFWKRCECFEYIDLVDLHNMFAVRIQKQKPFDVEIFNNERVFEKDPKNPPISESIRVTLDRDEIKQIYEEIQELERG